MALISIFASIPRALKSTSGEIAENGIAPYPKEMSVLDLRDIAREVAGDTRRDPRFEKVMSAHALWRNPMRMKNPRSPFDVGGISPDEMPARALRALSGLEISLQDRDEWDNFFSEFNAADGDLQTFIQNVGGLDETQQRFVLLLHDAQDIRILATCREEAVTKRERDITPIFEREHMSRLPDWPLIANDPDPIATADMVLFVALHDRDKLTYQPAQDIDAF